MMNNFKKMIEEINRSTGWQKYLENTNPEDSPAVMVKYIGRLSIYDWLTRVFLVISIVLGFIPAVAIGMMVGVLVAGYKSGRWIITFVWGSWPREAKPGIIGIDAATKDVTFTQAPKE